MIGFQSATFLKSSSCNNLQKLHPLTSFFKDALELLFKETIFITLKSYLFKYSQIFSLKILGGVRLVDLLKVKNLHVLLL